MYAYHTLVDETGENDLSGIHLPRQSSSRNWFEIKSAKAPGRASIGDNLDIDLGLVRQAKVEAWQKLPTLHWRSSRRLG